MDLSAFLTTQAVQTAKDKASSKALAHSAILTGGATGAPGNDFINMLFLRLAGEPQNTEAQNGATPPPLNPTQAVEAQITAAITPEHQEKIVAFLEQLVQAIPSANRAGIINPRNIKNIVNLDITEQQSLNSSPALIATGLTPQKLTELIDKITREIADGTEQGEGLLNIFIEITPVKAREAAILLPGKVSLTDKIKNHEFAGKTDFMTRLNQLVNNSNTTVSSEIDSGLPARSGFNRMLEILEQAQQQGVTNNKAAPNMGKNLEKALALTNKPSAGLSTVAAEMLQNSSANVVNAGAWEAIFPDGWDFAPGQSQSLTLTGTGQLASMVAHVQQAGFPHPATQMVAATIAKATTNGESKNITIKLDPPELGRVEIRMEFTQDSNGVKAHLVIEKPETYLMLQRDAHMLERALQEIGMDGGNSGLSFELADDGGMFGQDGNNHKGANNSGGGDGDNGEEEIEITETKMDWYIDPETGLTRYDFMV